MTKQLKLGALIVAAIASANTLAASEPHTKHGYVVSRESQEIVRKHNAVLSAVMRLLKLLLPLNM